MDGVEGRPNFFAIAETVEELDREGAEVSAIVQPLLAFGEFGNRYVAIFLEILVTRARIHEGHRGKIVSPSVMAAQFAVGSFPSPERCRGARNLCVNAKCVQQSVRRKGVQILPVGFHRRGARTFPQANLFHREGTDFPRYFLSTNYFAIFRDRIQHRILGKQDPWNQSGTGNCRGGAYEVSAG